MGNSKKKIVSALLASMVCGAIFTGLAFWQPNNVVLTSVGGIVSEDELIAKGGHGGHHGGHHGHHGGHHGHHGHHHSHHHSGHHVHHGEHAGDHHRHGDRHRGWAHGYWNGGGEWGDNPGYYSDPNYYYNTTTRPSVDYVLPTGNTSTNVTPAGRTENIIIETGAPVAKPAQ